MKISLASLWAIALLAIIVSGYSTDLFAQDNLPAPAIEVQPAIPPAPELAPPPGPLTGVYRSTGIRNHWVVLHDGQIRGRVSVQDRLGRDQPAADMYLKLLRHGVTIATTTSNGRGEFEFRGLGPGVYGLYGLGPSGMLAFSMQVVGEEDPRSIEALPPDGLQLSLRAIPPPFGTVAGIIRNAALRAGGSIQLSAAEQRLSTALVSRSNPPRFRIIQFGPEEIPSLGMPATTVRHHIIDLTPDGSMRGAVRMLQLTPAQLSRVDHSGLTVYLIRNDQRVQQSAVFEDGTFEVKSLQPGVYGFVVAGSWRYKTRPPSADAPSNELYGPPQFGFAAIQIETRPAGAVPPNPDDKGTRDELKSDAQLVSLNNHAVAQNGGFALEIALLQQMSIEELRDFWQALTPQQQLQLLSALGAPPGGGAGGGGGGFGGLLSLLGLAGLAGGGGGGGNGAASSNAE